MMMIKKTIQTNFFSFITKKVLSFILTFPYHHISNECFPKSGADQKLRYLNKRYLISNQSMSIEEHHHFCRDNGMTVGFIRNNLENDYLMSHNIGFLRLGAVWNQPNHSFEWTDGSSMNYSNWKWSRTFRINCIDVCCTVLMDQSGEWNIYGCASEPPAYALCQKIVIRTHQPIIASLNNRNELRLKNLKFLLERLQRTNPLKSRTQDMSHSKYRLFIILFNVPILVLICFCLGCKYYCKRKHTSVNSTDEQTYVKSSVPHEQEQEYSSA